MENAGCTRLMAAISRRNCSCRSTSGVLYGISPSATNVKSSLVEGVWAAALPGVPALSMARLTSQMPRQHHTIPEYHDLDIDMLQSSQSAEGTGGMTSRAD